MQVCCAPCSAEHEPTCTCFTVSLLSKDIHHTVRCWDECDLDPKTSLTSPMHLTRIARVDVSSSRTWLDDIPTQLDSNLWTSHIIMHTSLHACSILHQQCKLRPPSSMRGQGMNKSICRGCDRTQHANTMQQRPLPRTVTAPTFMQQAHAQAHKYSSVHCHFMALQGLNHPPHWGQLRL